MALNKDEILDAVANMTVLELSELIKMMEEKFGVSAAAAAVAVAAPAGAAAAASEKSRPPMNRLSKTAAARPAKTKGAGAGIGRPAEGGAASIFSETVHNLSIFKDKGKQIHSTVTEGFVFEELLNRLPPPDL